MQIFRQPQRERQSKQSIRDRKMSDFNIEEVYLLSYSQGCKNNRKVKQGFSRLFALCKSAKFGVQYNTAAVGCEFSKSSPEHASTDLLYFLTTELLIALHFFFSPKEQIKANHDSDRGPQSRSNTVEECKSHCVPLSTNSAPHHRFVSNVHRTTLFTCLLRILWAFSFCR